MCEPSGQTALMSYAAQRTEAFAMKFFLASLTALFLLSAAPAFAGDGSLDQGSLSRMGHGGMKALSDHDGMAIRGQFAIAYSTSFNTKGTTYTIINQPVGNHFAI